MKKQADKSFGLFFYLDFLLKKGYVTNAPVREARRETKMNNQMIVLALMVMDEIVNLKNPHRKNNYESNYEKQVINDIGIRQNE
ncbi:hypothetical protein ACUIJ5_31075 (plasmid) [Bacillus toyonensis]